jgi:hypothetical protein
MAANLGPSELGFKGHECRPGTKFAAQKRNAAPTDVAQEGPAWHTARSDTSFVIGSGLRIAGVFDAADIERISGQMHAQRQLRSFNQTVS